ncbi:MAG: hypothetical protein K2X27_17345 [Candidatus Obscuribacterales bacterium]|nr:hypothetical protein [Candidatus Obscuribacterales bacterium]
MQSVNLKTSSTATLNSSQKQSGSVWKQKLDASSADKLSKLLQRAGIIGKEQLCDAMEIAESLNKSIDQVLSTSFLTEKQIELCALAMNYLERGLVTEALAADGLKMANARGLQFREGLKYFGYGW